MFAKLRTVAVAFAVIVAACGPAHAQTQQQLDWCRGEDGATLDEQISGCTAIIQSGRSSGDDLAEVLSLRGVAYVVKGQLDRAIHDFDQAIRLAPDFADAFYKRSLAKEQLSDKPGAEADMATAKRINPNIEKELEM